jgi:hypothetical protein
MSGKDKRQVADNGDAFFKAEGLGEFENNYSGLVDLIRAAIARLDDKLTGLEERDLHWTLDKLKSLRENLRTLEYRVVFIKGGEQDESETGDNNEDKGGDEEETSQTFSVAFFMECDGLDTTEDEVEQFIHAKVETQILETVGGDTGEVSISGVTVEATH